MTGRMTRAQALRGAAALPAAWAVACGAAGSGGEVKSVMPDKPVDVLL